MSTRRKKVKFHALTDSALYKLKSRKRLTDILLSSSEVLTELKSKDVLYERRWKHKKEEKWLRSAPSKDKAEFFRPIDIPDHNLKIIQSRIAKLLSKIEPPDYLYSPVSGRSYVENAAHHKGARAFKLLDIADYFPSCTANRVAWFFGKVMQCSPDVAAILVRLTTHNECLPQGSPCSPILAYFSNLSMWDAIHDEVTSRGCKFSVYADDLTISGEVIPGVLVWKIKQIIHKHGFRIKAEKETSLIDAPADITGVIVRGERTLLPNRQLKKLKELREDRRQTKSVKLKSKLDNQIHGRLSQRRQVESSNK